MERAAAFAPGNVSCIFKIVPHEDPARMHSLGMGFTVRDGVTAVVCRSDETVVTCNGRAIEFSTVEAVVGRLADVSVRLELESSLPFSSGFGLSGASALATAYAVDALLELGRKPEELAMAAHVAEVENLTGLGDVCAQYHGGCLVKLQEGHPLVAEPLGVPEQPVFYRYFGPIHTRDVLRDAEQKERINRAADRGLAEVQALRGSDPVDFEACIRVSLAFAVDSGLLRDERVRRVIDQVEEAGGAASMIMLGDAVFSTCAFEGAQQTALSGQAATVL